jgi:hypothetical protein
MLALIAADLHLGQRFDEEFALRQIVGIAIEKEVGVVIFLGDVFDKQSNRSSAPVALCAQMDRLEERDISVWFIQGQHEKDTPPWLECHEWPRHIDHQVVELGPYKAYALDFLPYGTLQEELAKIPPECDALFAHQGWSSWLSFEGAPQGDFEQIPEHIELLITGDFHPYKNEVHRNAAGKPLRAISPGTTVAQKIDEPHVNYVVLMDEEGVFKKKRLKSRTFIDCGLLVHPADLDKLIGELEQHLLDASKQAAELELPPEMAKPIIRVEYNYKLPDVRRRVERALNGRALAFFYEQCPKEVPIGTEVSAEKALSDAVTPLSALPQALDHAEHPAAFELVERLLNSQAPPEEELLRWRADFLETA